VHSQGEQLLTELFPACPGNHASLPPAIIEQLRQLRQPSARSGGRSCLEVGERRVEISFLSSTGPDEFLFRLTEVTTDGDEQLLQQRLQLTSREAEVLLWLSGGKSNREIGEILHISPRTVNKHLEQIFVKLGVENRAAAAARAVRALAR
jgi:DNA-binding CsgD family transcriptional regulator